MNEETTQGPCRVCGALLQFALQSIGATIPCPVCQQPTELAPATTVAPEEDFVSPGLTTEEVISAFKGTITKPRTSIIYQLGLLVVTIATLLLPVLYLGLVVLAAWGTYYWATEFRYLLTAFRGGGFYGLMFRFFMFGGPLFVGVVLTLFMIKLLFASAPKHSQPLALNPENEPVLFAFIRQICRTLQAPMPTRVDVDCDLNASASFRSGTFSFLRGDLVLPLGLPLVAGFNANQLAEVIAHEFGHFNQGLGMRLSYVIRRINAWFYRVIYERDSWDVTLDELAETEEFWVTVVVGFARLGVWFSRLILKLLMWIGHLIGCFLIRQMEYDADASSIRLAGSQTFEESTRRLHVLSKVLEQSYTQLKHGFAKSKMLPDNFPAFMAMHDEKLSHEERSTLENTMGLEPTSAWSTHPSHGDRIRRARQVGESGVFSLDVPATALFSKFGILAQQVTRLHYTDDLGIPEPSIHTRPVFSENP